MLYLIICLKGLIIRLKMSYNEQLQSKIALLNQYTLCLERENQSKSKQIGILHRHLAQANSENDSFRQSIFELQSKMRKKVERSANCSLQTSSIYDSFLNRPNQADASIQTVCEDEEQCGKQLDEIIRLNEVVKEKEQRIRNYQSECEQMYEAIVKLQKEVQDYQEVGEKEAERIKRMETQLKSEEKRRVTAEKYLRDVKSSFETVDEEKTLIKEQYYQIENENLSLVSENNRLIEQIRQLSKQKNQYYHQLKRFSRISFGGEGLSKSSLKREPKVKDERWRQIEANLRNLQIENEAMQSNLMIRR